MRVVPSALSEFAFFAEQLGVFFARLGALVLLIACVCGLGWLGAILLGVN